ncbi:hypothetical protein A6E15_19270 [Natrinema saccharevitans]|uniref:Uncharacterized protein n=1 Tax=Natrinema saccharevitans TaxID=301967 RepID=A0A1S8AR70_9EURY|nr:hypothetical protein [Natrinema saccharevitans]OLZ39106.1 hypothetical protein A6E15_19270 [Natrinema saccharevitans]
MLSDQAKDYPLRTKARLLVGKFLVAQGYRVFPEELTESVQAEELAQMADRIDGVECTLQPEVDHDD